MLSVLNNVSFNKNQCQVLKAKLISFLYVYNQCKCWPGFHLKDDGKTCVDTDECSTTLPCSQRCINTYGSFKCLCVDGYEALERSPNKCKALSGQTDFFFFFYLSLNVQNFKSHLSSNAAHSSFQLKSLFSLWRTTMRSGS